MQQPDRERDGENDEGGPDEWRGAAGRGVRGRRGLDRGPAAGLQGVSCDGPYVIRTESVAVLPRWSFRVIAGRARRVALALATAVVAVVPGAAAEPLTFTRDIAPIVFARCAACHRAGEIAPFPLLTYRDVRQRLTQIKDVTERGVMPPWKPRPGSHPFLDDRSLTAVERERLLAWIGDGAPEGSAADLPAAPAFASGWQLGVPDLVVSLPAPYQLRADGPDLFRSFVLPVPTDRARYVRAIEFHPGNPRAVHHANMGVDRTRSSRRLDTADAAPGYEGGMVPDAEYPPGYMLGWTPGQNARPSPDGMAWRLEPQSDFVVQLHMQPTGKSEPVQPSVAFYFTDTPPRATPVGLRLGSQTIDIPPGDAAYTISDRFVLPVDADLLAVQPHAHNLGRRVTGTMTRPGGDVETLIAIDDWDFRWQDVYRYASPIRLPRGTTVSMTFVYDNSAANARNPFSPPRRVVWGQNTSDEMGDLWLQLVPARIEDLPALREAIQRKSLSDDIAAYTKVMRADPQNPLRHDALATLQLQAGRIETAVAEYRESLRLNPDSAPTHYNLGLALSMLRRYPEATTEFEAALAIDPRHAEAHNNLGAMLHVSGRFDEAVAHYREAIALNPENAEANSNLGRLLIVRREFPAAIRAFRDALRVRPDSVSALAGLALVLAAAPAAGDRAPAEALALAERAVSLTARQEPASLDALAAGYAALGNFVQAQAAATEAVQVAQRLGMAPFAGEIQGHLESYRQSQPLIFR